MTPVQARKAAERIAEDLLDRSGLGNAWEDVDPDVQEEILEHWTNIIFETLED
jgi:hypothetical protein